MGMDMEGMVMEVDMIDMKGMIGTVDEMDMGMAMGTGTILDKLMGMGEMDMDVIKVEIIDNPVHRISTLHLDLEAHLPDLELPTDTLPTRLKQVHLWQVILPLHLHLLDPQRQET